VRVDRAAGENFDVMWVMRQVGHADSKMTNDVYAQLQQRARQHGEAFDALVRRARERLNGTNDDSCEEAKKALVAGPLRNGETRTRTGGTTIFSQSHAHLELVQKACKSAGSLVRPPPQPGAAGRVPAARGNTRAG
jgi:hypothetical protein